MQRVGRRNRSGGTDNDLAGSFTRCAIDSVEKPKHLHLCGLSVVDLLVLDFMAGKVESLAPLGGALFDPDRCGGPKVVDLDTHGLSVDQVIVGLHRDPNHGWVLEKTDWDRLHLFFILQHTDVARVGRETVDCVVGSKKPLGLDGPGERVGLRWGGLEKRMGWKAKADEPMTTSIVAGGIGRALPKCDSLVFEVLGNQLYRVSVYKPRLSFEAHFQGFGEVGLAFQGFVFEDRQHRRFGGGLILDRGAHILASE